MSTRTIPASGYIIRLDDVRKAMQRAVRRGHKPSSASLVELESAEADTDVEAIVTVVNDWAKQLTKGRAAAVVEAFYADDEQAPELEAGIWLLLDAVELFEKVELKGSREWRKLAMVPSLELWPYFG